MKLTLVGVAILLYQLYHDHCAIQTWVTTGGVRNCRLLETPESVATMYFYSRDTSRDRTAVVELSNFSSLNTFLHIVHAATKGRKKLIHLQVCNSIFLTKGRKLGFAGPISCFETETQSMS